jgi:hypothetical protein
MAGTRGQDHKLYRDTVGTWGSESWDLVGAVVNDEWTRERVDIELPQKGNDIQRHTAGSLNMSFSVTLRYSTGDADRAAFEASFAANTSFIIAITNGVIATSGTVYWKAEVLITSIGESHENDGAVEQTIELQVADTVNDPAETTVV